MYTPFKSFCEILSSWRALLRAWPSRKAVSPGKIATGSPRRRRRLVMTADRIQSSTRKNHLKAVQISTLLRAFVLSLILHIAFGATSYALLYLADHYASNQKLPTGHLLTTDVTFEKLNQTEYAPSKVEQKGLLATASTAPLKTSVASTTQHAKSGKNKQKQSVNNADQTSSHEGSAIPKQTQNLIPDINNVYPEYPEEERQNGREATCIVKMTLVNGAVETMLFQDASINCSKAFQDAARTALSSWHFSGVKKHPIDHVVPIIFRLHD
jgi:hypothetical protein